MYKGFNTVELTAPKKSTFDMSHQKRLSTRAGRLTPVLCTECIPGDVWSGSTEALVRLAPLLAPIYDSIQVYVHFYFDPNRLLWDSWEDFITGGRLGETVETPPVPPICQFGEVMDSFPGTFGKSTLADYLGCPLFDDLGTGAAYTSAQAWINVMPFVAYQHIWLEYYRDRNFVADDVLGFDIPLPSGDIYSYMEDAELFTIRTRAWSHDYFTSALPFTQRGAEVLMPITLGGFAPLYVDPPNNTDTSFTLSGTGQPSSTTQGIGVVVNQTEPAGMPAGASAWVMGEDFTNTSSTIQDFRQAYALQVWLERNAIGGSRYVESNLVHFKVQSQDQRLQRPEYIGGGVINVRISEVVSTAYSSDGSGTVPLANLAGHGITYGNTNKFKYYCREHGFIIGILSIMSPPSYHQGLPRMFQRNSFLDYVWPTFATLGEQPVYNYELYASPATFTSPSIENTSVFGYQSRYCDWKWIQNSSHGEFHDTLMFWTLVRDFASLPVLGNTFVTYDQTIQDRIFAVEAEDNFWIYLTNKLFVNRCLPYFSRPNTLGFQ